MRSIEIMRKAARYVAHGRWGDLKRGAARTVGRRLLSYGERAVSSRTEKQLPKRLSPQHFLDTGHSRSDIWWQKLYLRPAYDLGDAGMEEFSGIYSPLYDGETVGRYVHEQFCTGAENHATKYVLHAQYQRYLAGALAAIGLAPEQHPGLAILDVGSGAGNTIVPLLRMFPQPRLLATELSPHMLAALKRVLHGQGLDGQCALLQLNAEEIDFVPESFDLIVGGAILHHLLSPEKALAGCAKILKPGAAAIFFEPFLNGNVMLQTLFQVVLDQGVEQPLPRQTADVLRGFIRGIDDLKGEDKSARRFLAIDDKWLFTKPYFFNHAAKAGFSECIFQSLQAPEDQFERQATVVLEQYAGLPAETFPAWARQIVRQYDRALSNEQKQGLLIEGAIILRK